MKKLFTLCILTFLSIKTFAYDVEIDGIYYNLDNETKTASVTSCYYYRYEGDIVIPSSIIYNGITYLVNSIGDEAFRACSGLISVSIPNSVNSIGRNAFALCRGLTSVSIPNSVTRIGQLAFEDSDGLESVNISDLQAWCNIDFSDTYSNPLYYANHLFMNGEEIKNLVIPDNISTIRDYTFYNCYYFTSVTIPSSVTNIDSKAFYNCFNLNTIYSLNPTPPICKDVNTFRCYDNVRNQDDVYTYANLHVPMGCKEIYAASHVWRYFNKIKEDMEYNGTVYYANLTVQQGTTGYTRQAVKADETYTIFIGSFGDNKVNAVTFNGEDVTDEVVNGYYTTPEIKGESVLTVSYETKPEGIPSASLKNVRVTGFKDAITISNIEEASDVFVYSADGILIDTILSAYGTTTINVASEQMYIVKVGDRTYKIAI